MATRKVIAGPAGHWYALWTDWQFGETLIGRPMMRGETTPPAFPDDVHSMLEAGWYEITDPAPGADDAAIVRELKG